MKKTKDELINTNELFKTVDGKILLASHALCLDKLINDENWLVRKEVAKQSYGLDILVNDENWLVRRVVAEQGYGLDTLINDEEYDVRIVAKRKLKEKGEK